MPVPRSAEATRTPSICPRHMPLRVSPGIKLSWKHADDLSVALGDGEQLVRVLLDCGEGVRIAPIEFRRAAFARAADRVVGKQSDDHAEIFRAGAAEGERASSPACQPGTESDSSGAYCWPP